MTGEDQQLDAQAIVGGYAVFLLTITMNLGKI